MTCLTADTCLTEDPGFTSWIASPSHTFVEIAHEIISMAILLPSGGLRRAIVSFKRKYVNEVLINHLVNLPQKVWLGELTIPT